jgi:transposase-like protein
MAEQETKAKKERTGSWTERRSSVQRSYTDDERQLAVAAVAANGGNVYRTALQQGIPVRTLDNWVKGLRHPELSQTVQEKKDALADRLEQIVSLLAEGLDDPDKIADAPLNVIATSLGITIDKIRLLRGEGPPGAGGVGGTGNVPPVIREILDPNASRDRIASVAARSGIRVPSDFVSGPTCTVPIRPVPAA